MMQSFRQLVAEVLDQGTTASGRARLMVNTPGPKQEQLPGDQFILDQDDPLADAHHRISLILLEHLTERQWFYSAISLNATPAGQELANLSAPDILTHVRALLIRVMTLQAKVHYFEDMERNRRGSLGMYANTGWDKIGPPADCLQRVLQTLMRRKLPYTQNDLLAFSDWLLAARDGTDPTGNRQSILSPWNYPLAGIVKALSSYMRSDNPEQDVIERFQQIAIKLKRFAVKETAHFGFKIDHLVGSANSASLPLNPGEAWSEQAIADIQVMPTHQQQAWAKLLYHAQTASGGKPKASWTSTAAPLVEAIGTDRFKSSVMAWFELVDKPRSQSVQNRYPWNQLPEFMISDSHMDILKGLVWMSIPTADTDMARCLTALAISSYRKIPGFGPRAVRLGNACVVALGGMSGLDGVTQLAILKTRIKFGTAQKSIEKALVTAAEREGFPPEELEEMAVPTYGLTDVGLYRVSVGEFTAEITIMGSKPKLQWVKPDGKYQKSVPKAVKDRHGEDLQELKKSVKDIERLLPAQVSRIEQLYLNPKQWAFNTWQTRYLDHPLVGTIARRLIWIFSDGQRHVAGISHHGKVVTHDDEPIDWLAPDTVVSIWHPIDAGEDEIVAWRDWLLRHEVRQPFKQAYRELYILTAAEEQTEVYSNRFASHILKQHQFNALCAARGWKNQLRLMVDDDFEPARIELPHWQLRAEFWVQGIGDQYGVDTNETGTYTYIATDQVRFYRMQAASNRGHAGGGHYYTLGTDREENHPLSLSDIPLLVLSEVMRDVDLFVGVASVGNDPNWSDGGPEGRFMDYWQDYSFGELSVSAETRKGVLERIIPRLNIADRCRFDDRFLVVRGDLRTYKIHLGSGNILMEPSDTYLCIVVQQTASGKGDSVFLPFEGDMKLSIILSKALLLAKDTKIKDRTILSQIQRNA